MSEPWGPAGSALSFTGASGREWDLTFASPLGPSPSTSAVWLVRDGGGGPPLAAKRILPRPGRSVDDIVDEAALWRSACLAAPDVIVELVDVFVDRVAGAGSVVCLMGYAGKGHVPRGGKVGDQGVLHLIVALCDVVAAVKGAGGVHGNIAGGSVMLDGGGLVKVGGFAGEGGVAGKEGGGEGGDMWDVGVFVYGVCFKGIASADGGGWAVFPEGAYGEAVLGVLWEMLAPGDDASMEYASVERIRQMAVAAGGRADGVVSKGGEAGVRIVAGGAGGSGVGGLVGSGEALAPSAAEAVEKAIDKLVDGVDVGGAYSVVLGAVKGGTAGGDALFAGLFRCPISRDPIVAFRAMSMLHNLMLDGGEDMLDCVRRNERFMEWAMSSWTAEAARRASRPGDDDSHASCFCFVGGEIAYFSALLRRKAKFHMLSAGAFTGSWERTDARKEDGRCVIGARRRKVVGGIADLVEMASELGVLLAKAVDVEAAVKHSGLRSLVDECARAHDAVVGLSEECQSVESVEKLVPGYERVWKAAKTLIVAVRSVPAAGGAEWEESLAGDGPRQLVAEAEMRLEDEILPDMSDVQVDSAFEKESKEEKAERKAKEREERKEARRAEKDAKKAEKKAAIQAEKEALTAADGALVLHGAGDEAAAKVKTIFGDLLGGVDTGTTPARALPVDVRPEAGLSDAAALAAAFGAPPEAVDGQFLALPAPGGGGGFSGDEGSDDGGYEAYQARQEGVAGEQERKRQEGSTGAWAARAGYGGMALVTTGMSSGGMLAVPGKKHPVFCQCAQCQEAEAQLEASVADARAADGYSDDGRNDEASFGNSRREDDDDGSNGYYGGGNNGGGSYESVDYARDNGQRDYDSLSDSGGKSSAFAMPPPGRDSGGYYGEAEEPGSSRGERSAPKEVSRKAPSLPASLVVNMKRLRLRDKIGEGSFGVVYEGEYERKPVAIKKMHKQLLKNSAALEEFSYEVGLMCELKHVNILSCIAAKLKAPDVLLVTEFMKRGTLFDVLYHDRIRLTTALIRKIALQAAEGLAYLHECGYLHRDLKTSNVFVDGGYNIKIGDFGLSKDQAGANEAAAGGLSGTIQYLSPECLRGGPQTPKSDVYAYGLILWECWAGEPPFVGVEAMVAARRVLDESFRPTIPSHCSRPYAAIIQSCWASSPAARPTFAEVVDLIKTATK